MAKDTQKYKALIEIEYITDVFEGDPDDVYELADLEKPELDRFINSSLEEYSPAGYTCKVISLEPVIENVIGDK